MNKGFVKIKSLCRAALMEIDNEIEPDTIALRRLASQCLIELDNITPPNQKDLESSSISPQPCLLDSQAETCPQSMMCFCRATFPPMYEKTSSRPASSPSGPENETLQEPGPDSSSTTPATPDGDSQGTTGPKADHEPQYLIYIAGPYWSNSPSRRELHRQSAQLLAVQVAEAGFFPVTPHLNTAGFERFTHLPESFYHAGDLKLLVQCDAMILAQGWENSRGTLAEIQYAEAHSIPYFQTLEELRDAFAQA